MGTKKLLCVTITHIPHLSYSVSRVESLNPLANGLLSIFSLVIWKQVELSLIRTHAAVGGGRALGGEEREDRHTTRHRRQPSHDSPAGSGRL